MIFDLVLHELQAEVGFEDREIALDRLQGVCSNARVKRAISCHLAVRASPIFLALIGGKSMRCGAALRGCNVDRR